MLAANWKMHKTQREAAAFVRELAPLVQPISGVEVVIAPVFTGISAAAEAARDSNIGVSAQDLYWEREGAFTGEVSAAMIKEAGAHYVIVGHSERRKLFGDTDVIVNRKVMAAMAGGTRT